MKGRCPICPIGSGVKASECEKHSVEIRVIEARFKWRFPRWHPWESTRSGWLLGHPVELYVASGDRFVGNGHIRATLPAHDGYPAVSQQRGGMGGGRRGAMQLAKSLLIQRLKKGHSE